MNSWTVPTKFGGKGGGLVQSAGLVLHLMVEESKVCATIDDAIGRFARGALGFDDSMDRSVATTSNPGFCQSCAGVADHCGLVE